MHGAPSAPQGRRNRGVADTQQGPSRGALHARRGEWCRRLSRVSADPFAPPHIPRRTPWRSSSPDATSRSPTDSGPPRRQAGEGPAARAAHPARRRRREPRAQQAPGQVLRPGRDHLSCEGPCRPGRGVSRRQVRRARRRHGQAHGATAPRPGQPPRCHRGRHAPESVAQATARASAALDGVSRRRAAEAAEGEDVDVFGSEGNSPIEVREKVHATTPMTLDQAVREMELRRPRLLPLPRRRDRPADRGLPPPRLVLRRDPPRRGRTRRRSTHARCSGARAARRRLRSQTMETSQLPPAERPAPALTCVRWAVRCGSVMTL